MLLAMSLGLAVAIQKYAAHRKKKKENVRMLFFFFLSLFSSKSHELDDGGLTLASWSSEAHASLSEQEHVVLGRRI